MCGVFESSSFCPVTYNSEDIPFAVTQQLEFMPVTDHDKYGML